MQGLYYNWSIVSFYNENEHSMGGPRYTRCWDQLRPLVEKISPGIILEGPETVSSTNEDGAGNSNDYLDYFLDPKNHVDNRAPEILSFHWAVRVSFIHFISYKLEDTAGIIIALADDSQQYPLGATHLC